MADERRTMGARGEAAAERALTAAGYTICERNWRGAGAEIDRIAWDGGTLVFVEIRARAGLAHGGPEATIRRSKQRRVARGALAYLLRFPARATPPVRFDVVAVTPKRVEIIKDAFTLDSSFCEVPNL